MATDATSFPFVDVPGIANFRDIGGNPTTNGASTTKGLIFRCADPSRVDTEGLEKMSQDLGKVNHHPSAAWSTLACLNYHYIGPQEEPN
jgi:hypothetical protein